ncbi:MAG: phenyltransferase domain-containing protein [Deltaproteobacteria bacterium]|nr:phenyltransferase domain-containing protein [Deltaproteobacteria bacterium]
MNAYALRKLQELSIDIEAVAGLIADTQKENGEIPWSPGDKTDPWDHVEAAMGLCMGGHHDLARKAYRWLADIQLEDGSWFSSYRNGTPEDKTRDTNMSSYLAVGMFHYYLVTGDVAFLHELWEPMAKGIAFALRLQRTGGEIYWAISPEGVVDNMALLTGSSSIYMSLKCAVAIAKIIGYDHLPWKQSMQRLGDAIRYKGHLFNMTKARFSMDWFYPVLSGAVQGKDARKRIDRHWKKFIVSGQGVRCVSDEPWVTLAETSELSLALSAMGNREMAEIVFNWIIHRKFEDGSYWCGYTYPDIIVWPQEKITWTNAVILMAADAIYGLTPASQLFSHRLWATIG